MGNLKQILNKILEIFEKNLVTISIKFYLRIAQILVIVYQNFLFFVEFPQVFIKISSHLTILKIFGKISNLWQLKFFHNFSLKNFPKR